MAELNSAVVGCVLANNLKLGGSRSSGHSSLLGGDAKRASAGAKGRGRPAWGVPIALLGLAMAGCGEPDSMLSLIRGDCQPSDAECFVPIEAFEKTDLGAASPAASWDYVELREGFYRRGDTGEDRVMLSSGVLCATATDATACVAAFAALRASELGGFGHHGHPSESIYYLAVNAGDRSEVVDTIDGLRAWLGPIDAVEDALLWAKAHQYWWRESSERAAGIRKVADGYELIVNETVSLCKPIQTDRVRLVIRSNGTVQILARETAERHDDWCS